MIQGENNDGRIVPNGRVVKRSDNLVLECGGRDQRLERSHSQLAAQRSIPPLINTLKSKVLKQQLGTPVPVTLRLVFSGGRRAIVPLYNSSC